MDSTLRRSMYARSQLTTSQKGSIFQRHMSWVVFWCSVKMRDDCSFCCYRWNRGIDHCLKFIFIKFYAISKWATKKVKVCYSLFCISIVALRHISLYWYYSTVPYSGITPVFYCGITPVFYCDITPQTAFDRNAFFSLSMRSTHLHEICLIRINE
jgi:hypothetical protein